MSSPKTSRFETIARRVRSISVVVVALVTTTFLLPVLLIAAILFDFVRWALVRKHWMALRLMLMGWIYLLAEVVGIVALLLVWVASLGGVVRSVLLTGTYAIQRWWAGALFSSIRRLFSLGLEVEGAPLEEPGPIVVLMRHASIIDNLLPSVLIASPHRIKLKYVLKKELLSDPALDIAGNRLPNYFVERGSTDSATEVAAVAALAGNLAVDEGVVIYPEGTRFTPERRERALVHLEASDPGRHRRAAQWTSVLPPRLGGTLALLEAEPPAEVLVVAHVGLDGFSHLRNILDGGLVGTNIRVRFQRYHPEDIPSNREARADWLFDRWAELNEWIESSRA